MSTFDDFHGEPVLIHIEDVAAGMFMRVTGVDQDGAPADVTGFIGWPSQAGELVAVPVAAERGGPAVVVLVDVDARPELLAPPARPLGEPVAADMGQLDRVTLTRRVRGEDGKRRRVREVHQVDTLDQVAALADDPATDNVILYALNWKGQR